ncbi:MAG: ornithine carbamoyltransferase [Gammaproteobacteria bacterium]|nr:ornithine carbamoyltransferase [Gammaproteobacteria bacterium]
MTIDLKHRNFLKLLDFSSDEIRYLLDLAGTLKAEKKAGKEIPRLAGKNIALIFEKISTRTRCAFEVAAYDQGANVTYLGPTGTQMGAKESMKDTARVLARFYDAVEFRGFDQATAELLGHHGIPVWNGLTNEYHPTQCLADLLTMTEHSTKPMNEISLCYLGDGASNMSDSLLVGAAKMGLDFRLASPHELRPDHELVAQCTQLARASGARLSITDDVVIAVQDVDFLYTDVWLSMGQPESDWGRRIELLKPFQVDRRVLSLTSNPRVKFMHCLPAFHNRETEVGEDIFWKFDLDAMEVTDEVFESDASIVFDQAENRLHTIKAVMVATLAD